MQQDRTKCELWIRKPCILFEQSGQDGKFSGNGENLSLCQQHILKIYVQLGVDLPICQHYNYKEFSIEAFVFIIRWQRIWNI